MKEEQCEQITPALRDLKSLISHAQAIEKDFQTIARSLKEQPVASGSYQIVANIDVNLVHLKEIFSGSDDIKYREVLIATLANRRSVLVFVESMSSQQIINEDIIEKLTLSGVATPAPAQQEIIQYLKDTILTAASIIESDTMEEIVTSILMGTTALFVDGVPTALIIDTRGLATRAISDPITEVDIAGPRESFTEDLRTNISLVRRRLKNPNLVVKSQRIGLRSKTNIAVVYFKGIVNSGLVCEMERRLQNLQIDAVENLGLQRLLEDHPNSPFPTIVATERPDKFVMDLVNGKVGLIIDGTPFCLMAPAVISDFFKAGDDYLEKWMTASFLRLLRYIGAFFALTVPAIYVAITAFHPAFIPTPLALTIGSSREGVPFPTLVETLLMLFFLEVMQEAGIRMPKNVGQAVSIVGGLVIGDSAVRAGLVSSSLVIITSFTAIATFSISSYRMVLAIRVLRVFLTALGAVFGMFGVVMGVLMIIVHLCILESFSVPYVAPLVPRNLARIEDVKDTVIVAPPASMQHRPTYLEPEASRRQKPQK